MFLSNEYNCSLYNWIVGEKDECPHHRIFEPFFSYIGVIIISFIFLREKIGLQKKFY